MVGMCSGRTQSCMTEPGDFSDLLIYVRGYEEYREKGIGRVKAEKQQNQCGSENSEIMKKRENQVCKKKAPQAEAST